MILFFKKENKKISRIMLKSIFVFSSYNFDSLKKNHFYKIKKLFKDKRCFNIRSKHKLGFTFFNWSFKKSKHRRSFRHIQMQIHIWKNKKKRFIFRQKKNNMQHTSFIYQLSKLFLNYFSLPESTSRSS